MVRPAIAKIIPVAVIKMTPKEKNWIDNASYEQLLRKWRNAPAGDSWFQGETGKYFANVMAEKKAQNPGGAIRASKNTGW